MLPNSTHLFSHWSIPLMLETAWVLSPGWRAGARAGWGGTSNLYPAGARTEVESTGAAVFHWLS
jgi:hypothetical protein